MKDNQQGVSGSRQVPLFANGGWTTEVVIEEVGEWWWLLDHIQWRLETLACGGWRLSCVYHLGFFFNIGITIKLLLILY